jgi:hypothetical protein
MKKIVTILVLLTTLSGFSQNFAPPGATWHYNFSSVWLFGFTKITQIGDTIIQGIQAQKLEMRGSYTFWEDGTTFIEQFAGYEYTYADQDHVYQLIGNEFKVLYDFTVQTNDTILIYNDGISISPDCDSVGRAIVTDTGTEIINGLELRWYEIVSLETSPFFLNGKIIERIGNITGYLFRQPSECLSINESVDGPFRCYEDDDFPEYKNPLFDEPCDFITGINELTKANLGLRVFPNPASGVVNVSVSENVKVEKVRVYEDSGRVVLEKYWNQSPQPPSPMGSSISLDVSNLSPGMYLLEVETKDGFREVKRFLIN